MSIKDKKLRKKILADELRTIEWQTLIKWKKYVEQKATKNNISKIKKHNIKSETPKTDTSTEKDKDKIELPKIDTSTKHDLKQNLEINNPQEDIVQWIKLFLKKFTETYPQVSKDWMLNYYFDWIVAILSIIDCKELTNIDSKLIPSIKSKWNTNIPQESRQLLKSMIRKFRNIEIQTIENKNIDFQSWQPINNLFSTNTLKYFDWEITVKQNIQIGSTNKIICIKIGTSNYFINHPIHILANKTIEILESYNEKEDQKKLSDFEILLNWLSLIYPEKEIVNIIYNLINEYYTNSKKLLIIPYYNKSFKW
jgi:hypothetical protein